MNIKAKYRGIFFMVLSALAFACMSVCVRMSGDVPTIQKTFFRNIVALVMATAVLLKEGEGFLPQDRRNWPQLFLRALFGTIGTLANFYAVDHLMLSDSTMLNKMSPFFSVLVSYFLLKEKIKPVQMLTLAGAFAGALCVIKPGLTNMVLVPSLVGLSSGFFAGAAYSYVRLLGLRGEKGPYIVFTFSLFSCLVTLPYILFNFAPMSWQQVLWLLGAGAFAAAGQFSITAAYCAAPAREVSVYNYSGVIFSAVLGFIFFNDRPDWLSILGYVLICGMAIINFRMNNRTPQIKT